MPNDGTLDVIHCAPIPFFIGRTQCYFVGARVLMNGGIEIMVDWINIRGGTARTEFSVEFVMNSFDNEGLEWAWEL